VRVEELFLGFAAKPRMGPVERQYIKAHVPSAYLNGGMMVWFSYDPLAVELFYHYITDIGAQGEDEAGAQGAVGRRTGIIDQ